MYAHLTSFGFGPKLRLTLAEIIAIRFLHFSILEEIWCFQFSSSSISTPRYLVSLLGRIVWLFIMILGLVCLLLVLFLKCRSTVLLGLNLSPHVAPHVTSLSRAAFIC